MGQAHDTLQAILAKPPQTILVDVDADRLEVAIVGTESALAAETQKTAAQAEEIKVLEARIAELEGGGPPLQTYIFRDSFQMEPVEDEDAYHLNVPNADSLRLLEPGTIRFKIRRDQPLDEKGKCKTEIGPRLGETLKRYGRIPFGVERWHAATLIIPSTWKRDAHKSTVFEFHGTEDEGETGTGRGGSISFHIGGDWIYGWRKWSSTPLQGGTENFIEIFRFPFVRERLYRFVTRTIFDWKPGGKGLTDIWVVEDAQAPRLLFTERGPNAYNDVVGPYFKLGLYRPVWNRGEGEGIVFPNTQFELDCRDLRIAGPGTKLEQML